MQDEKRFSCADGLDHVADVVAHMEVCDIAMSAPARHVLQRGATGFPYRPFGVGVPDVRTLQTCQPAMQHRTIAVVSQGGGG